MTHSSPLQQALDAWAAGNTAEAARQIHAALEADPENVDALHLAGLIAHQAGQRDTALALLHTAAELDPEFADVHANLGRIYDELGQTNAAHHHLDRASALDASDTDSTRRRDELQRNMEVMSIDDALHRGCALHEQGQLDDARTIYQAVLHSQADNVDALHLLGVLEAQEGNARAGIELIQRAIAIQPRQPSFHRNLAQALRSLGRMDEAAEAEAAATTLEQGG